MKGKLIAIEGIDGAGKTTLAHALVLALQAQGVPVVYTREPYTDLWREGVCSGNVDASTADRAAHVHGMIMPSLGAGQVIVTDRYYLSCAAYAYPNGSLKYDALGTQSDLFPAPDLWVWLDTPEGTCMSRVIERGEPWDVRLSDIRRAHGRLWDVLQEPKVRITLSDALPCVLAAVRTILEAS